MEDKQSNWRLPQYVTLQAAAFIFRVIHDDNRQTSGAHYCRFDACKQIVPKFRETLRFTQRISQYSLNA